MESITAIKLPQDIQKPDMLKIYLMEARAEILKVIRTPGFTVPSLMFPIMFYVFFGIIFTMNSAGMPTYLLATYGTFGVIGPALFSFGVGIAVERGQGWFDLKEVSPMPATAYVFARIAVTFFYSTTVVILLFLIGAIFGGVELSAAQWVVMGIVLVLGSLPFCAIGLSMGLFLKSTSAPAVVNLTYMPMSFLSGLWVPITMFPDALQIAANFLPPYHLAQLALKVIGMDVGASIGLHLAVLTLYFVIFIYMASKAYYKKDKS